MKIFSSILLALTTVLFVNFAFASDVSYLVNKLKNQDNISASFVQITSDDYMNAQKSSGYMNLKKPEYFKWITTIPNYQEIVSNGHSLWIYDKELEQVIVKKVADNNYAQTPYLILLENTKEHISELFDVKKVDSNSFLLIPKDKDDNMLNSITLEFDKMGLIKNLMIDTAMGQTTDINFYDVQNVDVLKASSFDFDIPTDVDVVVG